jgi:hypothetical protein
MRHPRSRVYRPLRLSAEAWAAADDLAAIAGMSLTEFIEGMLLELHLHHRIQSPGPRPTVSEQSEVIPLSQARRKRRHRAREPGGLDKE